MTDKEVDKLAQKLCDEFDRLFCVSAKAQFKKWEDMTDEEKFATKLMGTVFGSKCNN